MIKRIAFAVSLLLAGFFISACSTAEVPVPETITVSSNVERKTEVSRDVVIEVYFDRDFIGSGSSYDYSLQLFDDSDVLVEGSLIPVSNSRVTFTPTERLLPAETYSLRIEFSFNDVVFTRYDTYFTTEPMATALIVISNTDWVYNASNRSVTVTTEPTGLNYVVEYTRDGVTTTTPPVDAGTYTITVEIVDEDHYGTAAGTMVINRRPVNVGGYFAQDKVYDGTDAVVVSGTPVLGGLLDEDVRFGSAVFRFSSVDSGEDVPVVSTVTLAGTRSGNYTVVQPVMEANIIRRPVFIVPTLGQWRFYGDEDTFFTYAAQGLVSGDSIAGNLSRVPGEDVGFYSYELGTISAGDNYAVTLVDGRVFEVRRRYLVVTPHQGQSKEYLDEEPVISYSLENLVEGDEVSGLLSRVQGEEIGVYEIRLGTFTAGENYSLFINEETFEITPRYITVEPAASQLKAQGETDPVLAYLYSPVPLDGDFFTGAIARRPGETPGTYEFLLGTLTLPDYYVITFDTKNRTFTITE